MKELTHLRRNSANVEVTNVLTPEVAQHHLEQKGQHPKLVVDFDPPSNTLQVFSTIPL